MWSYMFIGKKRYLENIYKRQILVFFLNLSLHQAFERIMKEQLIRKGNLNVRLHTLFLFLTKIKWNWSSIFWLYCNLWMHVAMKIIVFKFWYEVVLRREKFTFSTLKLHKMYCRVLFYSPINWIGDIEVIFIRDKC